MLDEDRRPGAAVLAALPVFPLPNVVLLPGMVLPLNVFEPRYLALVDHVRESGGHLGVPLLRAELDDEGRPRMEPVFGLGRLLSHQRLPDGRRFIRVEGLGRVRQLEELPIRDGFREVSVEILPEERPTNAHQLEVLEAELERIASTLDGDDDQMVRSVLRIPDVRVMLYAVTAIMPTLGFMARGEAMGNAALLELQQRCLSAENGEARVSALVEFAADICSALRDSDRFPRRMLN